MSDPATAADATTAEAAAAADTRAGDATAVAETPAVPPVPDPGPAKPPAQRLLFLDALRAFASTMIVWHHFALYEPLNELAQPLIGGLIDWFRDYSRATQVFFVVGGYVMARGMAHRHWDLQGVGQFIAKRYCRLGLPYLGAIIAALIASAFARGWLPDKVVGSPATLPQLLAHLVFLQDILDYEQLSAGLWFVCINFQLGLMYVGALFLRDTLARAFQLRHESPWIDVPLIGGWLLSAASLFYFNLDPAWDAWAVYFFPYFFMGIVVQRAPKSFATQAMFMLYLLLIVVAMAYNWRWRLVSAFVFGSLLFASEVTGFSTRWPKSRVIGYMGRTSYSLFLIHFPVLLVVATLWVRLGWTSAADAVTALVVAYFASVAASAAFYEFVEMPAARLSKQAG